jgi:hypothetical protein
MLEQVLLREKFQTLLDWQRAALGRYEAATNEADSETRGQLDQLCRDKKRHLELTERLLEIMEE